MLPKVNVLRGSGFPIFAPANSEHTLDSRSPQLVNRIEIYVTVCHNINVTSGAHWACPECFRYFARASESPGGFSEAVQIVFAGVRVSRAGLQCDSAPPRRAGSHPGSEQAAA